VAELPGIQALYDDYKDKVSFLLVSNEEFAVSGGFLAQKSYTLPLFKAIYTPPALMNTSSIPATFLIDKNGKLVIRKEGAADWNSNTVRKTIDALLQESSK
jgi:peroxiredoxin